MSKAASDESDAGAVAFRMERLAPLLGLYALVGGLITLAGWVFGVNRLTNWDGSGTVMKGNAACVAIAAGAAMLFITLRRTPSWPARALAAFSALVGGLTLFEHIAGINLGIDTLLWDEPPGARATAAPGRMGPPASSACLLYGVGLLLSTAGGTAERRRTARTAASVLGGVVLSLGLIALLGYLFGGAALYDVAPLTGISLQMSSIVFALGLALICSLPDREPVRSLNENSGAGLLARRALPLVFVLPILLGWLCTLGQNAGLYDAATGRALLVFSLIGLLCGVLWWGIRVVAAREEEVTRSEALFRTLGEAVPDLLWISDVAGVPLYQNPAWTEYTGLDGEALRRSGWEVLHHPDELPMMRRLWAEARGRGEAFQVEARMRRKDGVFRWFVLKVVPLRLRPAEPATVHRWVGTAMDIDERKLAEQERAAMLERERAARQEAEHSARLKDQFLATLSHELRTPLNAIVGWSHLLKKDMQDPVRVHQAVEVIERNARIQAHLIADLLDLSRFITGNMQLDMQPVDLIAAIKAAVDSLQPAADAKGVRMVTYFESVTDPVNGDPARLQQAIWNLLSNAVKFSFRGGRVEIRLRRVDAHLEIAVSDTGEGIAPEILPHVFDRFRQADSSESRRHGGLGIGLALVKLILELHGGTVHASSGGKGAGAAFVLSLPRVEAPARREDLPSLPVRPAPPAAASTSQSIDLTGMVVLLVDDEDDGLEMVRRMLEDYKAAVVTATSAAEALRHLRERTFDVIISDIGMPGRDGYDLLREARARGVRTPAVALTAFARSDDKQKAIQAGYLAHLSKPVDPAQLITTVAALGKKVSRPVRS